MPAAPTGSGPKLVVDDWSSRLVHGWALSTSTAVSMSLPTLLVQTDGDHTGQQTGARTGSKGTPWRPGRERD